MNWLKKLFGGRATPAKPEMDETALALIVRTKLSPHQHNAGRGPEELFLPVNQFLTCLEMRAAGSASLRLVNRPETVRAAARITLQSELMRGDKPFFYRESRNNTVFADNVKMRARDVADHASSLIDRGQVMLACAYAEALEDMAQDMETYATLRHMTDMSYNDGKNMGKTFEAGADENRDNVLQPVLRRKRSGIQPS